MPVAYDNATSSTGGGTPQTWSHTTSGSNRALFVSATGNGASFSGAPTYNAVSMTEIATQNSRLGVWGMANPASGANTVSVGWSASAASACVAVSYTDVDQTTPYDGVQTDGSSTTTPSVSVTSATGDLVAGYTGNVAITLAQSAGAGQTERAGGNITGTNVATLMSDEPGAASVTHSYTRGSTFLDQLLVAWNINAAGGGGGGDPEGGLIGGKLLRGGLLMAGVLVR